MKEITLNGRTYLSTKRAAEITGYTTDYVGQLARKGTVAAEQVGRNWYVAEDEIKKHKFGAYAGSVREEKEADAPALEILVEEAEEKVETPVVEEDEVEELVTTSVVTPVEEEKADEVKEESDPAATVAAMQEAWDEWYKSQRVVSGDEEQVFLKKEDVVTRKEEIEEEEQVPVTIADLSESEVGDISEGDEEELVEEYEEVVEEPVVQKGGFGLVAGAAGLVLVMSLIIGGGYIVVRNDLAPLSSVIKSTQNYFTGTTTFERDSR